MKGQDSQVQKAYETIRKDIEEKRLLPGMPIVNSALYERLGMSRTPVREALRRLEMEGVVEIIPHKGAVVKLHTRNDLLHAYEVLEGLDGMLVYLVAKQFGKGLITKEDTQHMHFLVEEMDRFNEENDNRQWVDCDMAFHNEMRALCGNELLVREINRFLMQFYYTAYHYMLPKERKDFSNKEHKLMLEYIESADAENARKVSQQQRKRMIDFLEEQADGQLFIV